MRIKKTIIRFLCIGLAFVLAVMLFSCEPHNIYLEKDEDVIAIGRYMAMYKNGIQFALSGLEKAEFDENTVFFNVSGKACYPDGEIMDVALIIIYNRYYQEITLRFWRDFEVGIGLDTKDKWEECEQSENGIKQYSDEEVEEVFEKASKYVQYLETLED